MSGGPIHDERGALIALAHAIEPGDARIGALIDTWGAEQVCERLRAGQIGVREQSSMQVRLARVDVDAAVASAHGTRTRPSDRRDADRTVEHRPARSPRQ